MRRHPGWVDPTEVTSWFGEPGPSLESVPDRQGGFRRQKLDSILTGRGNQGEEISHQLEEVSVKELVFDVIR